MPLPAFVRTWQFQVSQAIAASGVALTTGRNLMLAAKNSMLGAGAWTDAANAATVSTNNFVTDYSCDSVTAGAAGDGVDRWAINTNLVWAASGSAHSWTIVKQTALTGGALYVCIDLNSASVNQASVVISRVGFTGGTTTNRPTATDEVVCLSVANWGMSSADAAQNLSVEKSADGKAIRLIFVRGGWAVGLWFFEEPTTGLTWTQPLFAYAFGTSTTAPGSSQLVFANFYTSANFFSIVAGNPLKGTLATPVYATATTLVLGTQAVANDINAEWPLMQASGLVKDTYTYNSAIMDGVKGRVGAMVDLWWVPTALGEGDKMPAAGTANVWVLGDLAFPWNTSVPPIVGADVDGFEVRGLATVYGDIEPAVTWGGNGSPVASGELPTVPSLGAPVTFYIMQANDSMTGTRYDWRVSGTPDLAGAGYPGPNLPLKIAIAGHNP